MTIDLSGGLPPSREDVLAERPADPRMREAVNIWLQDDEGRFSLPRIGIEALAGSWDTPAVQANLAFADGRVLVGSCVGPAHSPLDESGRPAVIGAGPIEFRCVEPFRRWTMSFTGDALDTDITDQVAGRIPDGPRVDVELHVEMTMVVPPWVQGEMNEQARTLLQTGKEGLYLGGDRYEQLFLATGTLRVGDDEYPFGGRGLRVHRQGIRETGDFFGHCWQSAVMPSGRAFGYNAFPDNPDGSPAYRDAFVFDGERMLPASVVEAPWLSTFRARGGDVGLVLQSELGTHRIEAVTSTSTVMAGAANIEKVAALNMDATERRHSLFFHQGTARYTWDGETAYGMIERSLPSDVVSVDEDQGVSGSSVGTRGAVDR